MPFLVIENLCKAFRDLSGNKIPAVQDLNLTLAQNELLVLAGPSGCGKTTTLRLIAGLERADSGRISLDGNVLNQIAAKNRDVAMVFQTPALLPHMNAGENIAFGLKLRKVPQVEIEKRVSQATEILGLAGKLDRKPQELSGGEAQRVALGRALVREPKIFLLDEPLSHLDVLARKQLRREIRCLHQRANVPMIYVTHDPREALALGQRVAVMNEGKLLQLGTPDEIRQKPANEFVAEFFQA
jgi:multiple sugar transport system ATP-binding protein